MKSGAAPLQGRGAVSIPERSGAGPTTPAFARGTQSGMSPPPRWLRPLNTLKALWMSVSKPG